mgnify:CR=1 FL=1
MNSARLGVSPEEAHRLDRHRREGDLRPPPGSAPVLRSLRWRPGRSPRRRSLAPTWAGARRTLRRQPGMAPAGRRGRADKRRGATLCGLARSRGRPRRGDLDGVAPLPAPADAGALWRAATSDWRPVGLGRCGGGRSARAGARRARGPVRGPAGPAARCCSSLLLALPLSAITAWAAAGRSHDRVRCGPGLAQASTAAPPCSAGRRRAQARLRAVLAHRPHAAGRARTGPTRVGIWRHRPRVAGGGVRHRSRVDRRARRARPALAGPAVLAVLVVALVAPHRSGGAAVVDPPACPRYAARAVVDRRGRAAAPLLAEPGAGPHRGSRACTGRRLEPALLDPGGTRPPPAPAPGLLLGPALGWLAGGDRRVPLAAARYLKRERWYRGRGRSSARGRAGRLAARAPQGRYHRRVPVAVAALTAGARRAGRRRPRTAHRARPSRKTRPGADPGRCRPVARGSSRIPDRGTVRG